MECGRTKPKDRSRKRSRGSGKLPIKLQKSSIGQEFLSKKMSEKLSFSSGKTPTPEAVTQVVWEMHYTSKQRLWIATALLTVATPALVRENP